MPFVYDRVGSRYRQSYKACERWELLPREQFYFFSMGHGNESFNLIASLPGQYFPISTHGHGNAFVSCQVQPYLRCSFS